MLNSIAEIKKPDQIGIIGRKGDKKGIITLSGMELTKGEQGWKDKEKWKQKEGYTSTIMYLVERKIKRLTTKGEKRDREIKGTNMDATCNGYEWKKEGKRRSKKEN